MHWIISNSLLIEYLFSFMIVIELRQKYIRSFNVLSDSRQDIFQINLDFQFLSFWRHFLLQKNLKTKNKIILKHTHDIKTSKSFIYFSKLRLPNLSFFNFVFNYVLLPSNWQCLFNVFFNWFLKEIDKATLVVVCTKMSEIIER